MTGKLKRNILAGGIVLGSLSFFGCSPRHAIISTAPVSGSAGPSKQKADRTTSKDSKASTPGKGQVTETDSIRLPRRNGANTEEQYSPSTLIIFYDGSVGKEPLLQAVEKYKAEIIYDYKNFNSIAIRIPDGVSIQDAIGYFSKVEGVISVNRDAIYHLD